MGKERGVTLIEAVISLMIITLAMTSFYMVLYTIGRISSGSEQTMRAINTVSFYQKVIMNLKVPEDCEKSHLFEPVLHQLCTREMRSIHANLETRINGYPQTLQIDIKPYQPEPSLQEIHLTLFHQNKRLYKTVFLREAL